MTGAAEIRPPTQLNPRGTFRRRVCPAREKKERAKVNTIFYALIHNIEWEMSGLNELLPALPNPTLGPRSLCEAQDIRDCIRTPLLA